MTLIMANAGTQLLTNNVSGQSSSSGKSWSWALERDPDSGKSCLLKAGLGLGEDFSLGNLAA